MLPDLVDNQYAKANHAICGQENYRTFSDQTTHWRSMTEPQ